jgi:succinyl-CoA synthetase beta subunit
MASTEGGMDIEEVAAKTPGEDRQGDRRSRSVGLRPGRPEDRRGARAAGDLMGQAVKLLRGVYRTWWEATPRWWRSTRCASWTARTASRSLVAVDAKIGLDDNALYRHADMQAMRDLGEESPLEIEASKFSLNYIKLDGNIACLVNGAGWRWRRWTSSSISGASRRTSSTSAAARAGAGGGGLPDHPEADPRCGILVNIFGGIMDCNVIATGIVAAVRETGLKLPLVVRLEGNNVAAGKKTLAESGLTIITGDTMADAAQKVVRAVGA